MRSRSQTPLPRGSRVTREIEDICLNRALVVAAERALGRFRPAFVYQRSDAFITCGMTISVRHDLPLVLEWNGSALWARHNWRVRHRVKDVFDGFLTAVENESLARSVLVRAVSERAAEMAVENGAPPQRVVTIANGVDIRSIPAPAALDRRARAGYRLGWDVWSMARSPPVNSGDGPASGRARRPSWRWRPAGRMHGASQRSWGQ